MNAGMNRLFRRAQPVTVITEKGAFPRRGVIEKIGKGMETDPAEPTRYGLLSVPLYRYMGNAAELLDGGDAVLVSGEKRYTVLHTKKISGMKGCSYVEAVLERQVTDDDGE